MSTPKLVKVQRLDSIRLDANDKTYFTDEGYLVDHPILTSVGIFEYKNEDGSIRKELRLPEHVFDEKSLKTYKGKPIIITHDAGLIDKNNVDEEQVGTILSDGYQDGDNVRAEIIIHDTDEMKERGLKELSLGYSLDLIEEAGTWNGQEYDAIQTNIVINHLALVGTARAGEQARLNIDGSKEPRLKGERTMGAGCNNDGDVLTPEELEQAIEMFKKSKAESNGDADVQENNTPSTEDTKPNEENKDAETEESEKVGKTPSDIMNEVKARKEANAEESAEDKIARQDSDLDMLLACLEKFLAEEEAEGNHGDSDDNSEEPKDENKDSSDDQSKSMNNDSIDEVVRQRLEICRVGDKLNLDGLEHKSVRDAKRKIIGEVLPNMRLDGKSDVYVDAVYDMALNEVYKRKTVADQLQQMTTKTNMDSNEEDKQLGALSARERMIARFEKGGEE